MTRSTLIILAIAFFRTTCAQTIGNPNSTVNAMDVLTESHLLAAVTDKNRFEVWNYYTKQQVKYQLLDHRACGVAIGKKWTVVCRTDGYAEVFDTNGFDRLSLLKISDQPLYDVKNEGSKFVIIDHAGDFYTMDTASVAPTFTKRGRLGRFKAVCVMPGRDVLITSTQKGRFSFYSLKDGRVIAFRETGLNPVHALATVKDANSLVVASQGRGILYSINGAFELTEQTWFQTGAGFTPSLDAFAKIQAAGTVAGKVIIVTDLTVYKWRLPAMVNFLFILPDQFPNIRLAAGTQGAGIRILSAIDLKAFSK